jgi:hypothetical protein
MTTAAVSSPLAEQWGPKAARISSPLAEANRLLKNRALDAR